MGAAVGEVGVHGIAGRGEGVHGGAQCGTAHWCTPRWVWAGEAMGVVGRHEEADWCTIREVGDSGGAAGESGEGFKFGDGREYMEKHSVARLIGAPPGGLGRCGRHGNA